MVVISKNDGGAILPLIMGSNFERQPNPHDFYQSKRKVVRNAPARVVVIWRVVQ
jgi:hypothetical protein